MIIHFHICEDKSSSWGHKSESQLLPAVLLQKNKSKLNLIPAIILTILGLTLTAYPVKSQKPESVIQIPPDINLVIQVGAFVKETNSTVFKEKLAAIIDKPVIIVIDEGYYKVQLTGFKSIEEIEKIIPALGLVGIRDFWVRPARKEIETQDYADLLSDTTQNNFEEMIAKPAGPADPDSLITEESPADGHDIYALEIGVFREKNRALNAQKKIISKLNLPVEIIEQWNDYHVIITGFNNKTEINKYIPEIARMGYNEIYVLKNYKKIQ